MFFGLPDLDPLVRDTDLDLAPDPDPFIIKYRYIKKKIDSYCFGFFVTSV
jgi:hypothetical protein